MAMLTARGDHDDNSSGRRVVVSLVSVLFALTLAAGFVGCLNTATKPVANSIGEIKVGRFALDNPGSVNTYWLNTPAGPDPSGHPAHPV